jgi:predicted ATP-dependent serine protease
MSKMIWYCHDCGMVLKLWVIKCPNCHRSAVSWLQLVALAVVALPMVFLLLKFV